MVVVSLHWQGWDTSSLVRVHDRIPLARLARHDDPTFKLRGDSGFYDGAYFYAIARDPLATGQAHRLIEEAPYRYGHPAYGWLAWLGSFGGRPGAVPDALLAVGLASIFLAGISASLLAGALGWTLWGGLVVALNPGLIFSVGVDTTEPLGAALLLSGLLAYQRGRRGSALALFAALCFVKEPLVLVPLAIAAWDYWRRRRPPILAAAVAAGRRLVALSPRPSRRVPVRPGEPAPHGAAARLGAGARRCGVTVVESGYRHVPARGGGGAADHRRRDRCSSSRDLGAEAAHRRRPCLPRARRRSTRAELRARSSTRRI